MDLKSGYPFWSIRNGLMHAFPRLERDVRCDVAVIGGGITGALIADELVAHGHEVAVLEQREIGWGSTSASTALLQYEIDTPLVDLARRHGQDAAALAYLACAEAIDLLQERARAVGQVDYRRNDSLYYASRKRDLAALREELAARREIGLELDWVEPEALWRDYGVRAPGALVSRQAARMDPYRMTYRLLAACQRAGAAVHDRTAVVDVKPASRGIVLRTAEGALVRAGHVVVAAGYAGQQWLRQRVARNRSSYAFVTDPLRDEEAGALRHTMVWETARPYLYLRGTADGRVIAGGEDDSIDLPARRDARVLAKAAKLQRKIAEVMPDLQLRPVFAWGGTFAETADGLPFFGAHAEHGPRVLFAMAYGGNGITYSMLGAGLLRATIERRGHRLAALFGFGRLD
ncbi:FAD-dependent oxidoreductase [Stenotrophomonas sp. HITSZ_GD]|uniref:NAD(P)/FAD-dependent oxidoreductase n=1 Tax=Stenotrophomonas sp. HITSZ_GD TaxID=3037248 RepID=UPI00240D82AF|nr:FAD-dependent oxidoreductase [Stenotrophomonas sp. HITSZ_GD]MDG2524296.1 FAD-dependent oxidoreductase [Stenotrophomonas sp. HITSZ_GD]